MQLNEIITSVIAGGLLGVLGQGIRIAVGLKKLNDSNSAAALANKPPDKFDTSRLLISIFIGFAAGAIGMLVKGSYMAPDGDYKTEAIVTIIAIGYSGADFIEGLFNTYISKPKTQNIVNVNSENQNVIAEGLQNIVPDEAPFSNEPAKG